MTVIQELCQGSNGVMVHPEAALGCCDHKHPRVFADGDLLADGVDIWKERNTG